MDAPSPILLTLEVIRGVYEYGLGWALNMPLQLVSPRGDGHPVLVLPGLGTTDSSTHYIRNFLEGLGYDAQPWNQGRNMGPRAGIDAMITSLVDRVEKISANAGGNQVSIVGWSLGGIYAREIAKKSPDLVRQVITLGTPFKGTANSTNAARLYELLSKDKSHRNPEIIRQISEPPPVPFTSIYSKTDGVVSWKCSLENEGDNRENIEIPGASHLGLGHNPITMYVIANRLAQPKNTWAPYSE